MPAAAKLPKEKEKETRKPTAASHPPYFQMIKEAILALRDRTGSSPQAIAKHVEEKHKGQLPANFRKILSIQLKSFAAKGKLVKVKASFKLSEEAKKDTATAAAAAAATKPTKGKSASEEKQKPRKAAAVQKKKSLGAVKSPKKAVVKTKKRAAAPSPAKPKQPKSIKSPAAKKAKKKSNA